MITPSFGLTATERVLPKLSLVFTSASLDSRITFTRSAATATRVNSNGYVETVAADTPRFDFDPITKVCKGLLIEESRQNINIRSEDFNSTDYGWTSVNVTFNQTTAPDNSSNADLMVELAATSSHRVLQSIATAPAAVAHSVFVKAAGRKYFQLYTANNTSNFVTFDIEAGTVTRVGASVVASSIQNYGNGWYRCTAVYSANSTIFYYGLATVSNAGYSPSYTGDGVSGVYIWGAQVEAGSFATSYIPTAASAATRNADVATMTGTNFTSWWTATNGAAVVAANQSTVSGTSPWMQFDDTTASNFIVLRGNTTNPELYIKATTDQAQIDAGTIAAATSYNLGGAWNTNNSAAAISGNAAVTDLSVTVPTVTQARLGCDGTNYLNGWLRNVRYWPQRLTDSELQAFTK